MLLKRMLVFGMSTFVAGSFAIGVACFIPALLNQCHAGKVIKLAF